MAKQTVVFMDIDGTMQALCDPLNPPRISTHWMGEWRNFRATREQFPSLFSQTHPSVPHFEINFSTELFAEVENLSNMDSVTVEWFSDWGMDAVDIFAQETGFTTGGSWDFRDEKTVKRTVGHAPGTWWKQNFLDDFCAKNPDVQVVFVDDNATRDTHGIEERMHHMVGQHKNLFVLVPNTNTGLNRFDMGVLKHIANSDVLLAEIVE